VSMAGKWDGALEIGKALTKLRPDDEYGWLLAASQHAIGETYEAYQEIVAFIGEFPQCSAAIPYRAACYACALEELMTRGAG